MKSLIDSLPPEIAQQIHPAWRKNENDYWSERDNLLSKYFQQWIAFANGRVLASGKSPPAVLRAALESGQHPFVTCVGMEQQPWCRMRRTSYPYDSTYQVVLSGGDRILGRDVLNQMDVVFRGPAREVVINP